MNYVVIFNDKLPPNFGGMETHFKEFLDYFKKDAEWKCELVASKYDDKFIILNSRLEIVRTFETIENQIDFLNKRYKSGECVYFFNNGSWIEELEGIKETNSKVILCQRTGGNEFVKAPLKANLPLKEAQNEWAKIINKNLDCIVSNSEFTNNRLMNIGVAIDKIQTIRGGVESELCKYNIANKMKTREIFDGIYNTKNMSIITSAARLVDFKGIDVIIKAIASSKYKDKIFFQCIGDGPLKNDLLSLCQQYLNPENYTFVGVVDQHETLKKISISNIYCSTSFNCLKNRGSESYIHTETMGRSILEAICQNVTVISSDAGGAYEWFNEGLEIGILLEKADSLHLANAIDYVLENNIESLNGIEYCDKYSWKNIFSKYKNTWREILDERSIGNYI